jgi:hypothetical protein
VSSSHASAPGGERSVGRRTRQRTAGPFDLGAATVAIVAGTVAFSVYATTLLPGVDLGDTGGFQAAVLWPETSARRAYPLYYALAQPFVRTISAVDPARGLNLFSALTAAVAVALLSYAAASVARSAIAGAGAALLLAFSYTFWSQAIIAEVYALHLALVAACLIALHTYAARRTTPRLVTFFLLFAAAFGNHLAMLLLLPPFALFLLMVQDRPRDLFSRRNVALAAAAAACGACLYLPNLLSVWTAIDAPASAGDRLAAFWFDTTKADWRESLVGGVAAAEMPNRLAMWAWDARQQFGALGIFLGLVGLVRLWTLERPWAVLVLVAYGVSTAFALTYNVGDTHVFFLPGHLFVAFAAAAALAPPLTTRGRVLAGPVLAVALVLYAGWRGWDTWPRVDRSADRRGEALIARVTAGIDERQAVLLSALDWQSENALLYAARWQRRDLAWTRLADVMLHLPFFVRDNHSITRDVVLTSEAARQVVASFGPHFPLFEDPVPPAPPLSASIAGIAPGTPYVMTLLSPHNEPFDAVDVDRGLAALTGGREGRAGGRYEVWAGLAGDPPVLHRVEDRPFRETVSILGDSFAIHLDAWLPFDTFRRGGFGRVLHGRTPILTIERGVSLVWLSSNGLSRTVYAAGLYAPKPRFRIPASLPREAFAALRP